MMEKTVVELFAGVGGFRLGFERANPEWETVWFSQWEPGQKSQWAYNCYISHWPESADPNSNTDISEVIKSDIPDHNVLVGGFPCQDYSVARPLNGSSGIEGKKGVLWWQIYELAKEKAPAFILLENVDRLLKSPASQRGRDFGIMLACLNELDYDVEWRIINAADYGGAQRRRRVFIFAWKRDTNYSQKKSREAEYCLKTSGFFAQAFPLDALSSVKEGILPNEDVFSISNDFRFEFRNCGVMFNRNITTAKGEPKYEPFVPLQDILQHGVDEKYYINGSLSKWEHLKGAKSEQRTHKNGHEYRYAEGAIAFPDPIEKPGRTMLTSEATVNRSSHVVEDPQTKRIRLITPVEAERLQGFDDEWTNTGMPERARYFCMGNALVVPMVERMSKELTTIVNNE